MPQLPPNWHETQDARGRTYYFNSVTQESSWVLPPGTIEDSPQPPQLPPPGPPQMPKPTGPPQMPKPTGPPQLPGGGPPSFNSGPPPNQSLPPAPFVGKTGPPMLNVGSHMSNSNSVPPSPANHTPTNFPPPSPANRSGPPPAPIGGKPPMPPTTGFALPPLPGGPPSRQASASISIPPPMAGGLIRQPSATNSIPPPMPGGLPPSRQASGSVSMPPPMPGGAPPMPVFGNLPPVGSLPPNRAPSMSVSGPPPVPGGLPPSRQASGSVSIPPPMFNPRVSNPPPVAAPQFVAPSFQAPTQLAPPLAASPFGLPYPWKETTAANGKIYYYNTVTQETSWTRPTAPSAAPGSIMPTGADGSQLPLTTPANADCSTNLTNSTFPSGSKEYSGSIQLRSGVFKSWEPKYITIKQGHAFALYDNEQMKKLRFAVSTKHILAVPINRGDSRYTIVLYEFDLKTPPTEQSLSSQSSKSHYIDAGSLEVRQQLLSILYDQGAIIRTPIWESMSTRNKEPRFITIFSHQLEVYKKATEDEADIIVPFTQKTFFQTTPSQFPLLYEEGKQYGVIGTQTFVIADHCDEDATLHYITMQASSDVEYNSYIKKTKEAISSKQTKVDPSSLAEGWLYKASTNLQRWARRYFILRRDSLSYYKSRDDQKATGDVPLPNGFEIDLQPTNSPYPSSIFVAESGDQGTRQFLMCPLNEPDYNEWCNALSTLQSQKQVKKDENSIKEGYLNVCQHKVKPARKYCVVSNSEMLVYNSRNDPTPAQTVPIPKGCFVSESSLPGDDVIGTQKLVILSVTNPSSLEEVFFGFAQSKERQEWISTLKGIVGDAIAKSHPDSYREGYAYKSKKKGSQGSLKYIVVTPRTIYYSDKKEADVLSPDPIVQKRIKQFQLAGDAMIEEESSLPGFKGLTIPSTGDESGGDHMFVYFSDEQEFNLTRDAIIAATASVDWRRDNTSIFEGYIWKSNSSGKSWTYRYAILTSTSLTFYKKKLDQNPISQLPLPTGFQTSKVSLLDSTVVKGSPDREAIDHLASNFKIKAAMGIDVWAVAIVPPAADTTSKRIWIGSQHTPITTQWLQVFSEFSSIGRQMHYGSIKEGYLAYNGSAPRDRRYVSLHSDRIDLYTSRIDGTLETSIKLKCGFDVLYKDNFLYISNYASEDFRSYTKFTNAVGGELLHIWLNAFQEAYQACTPTTAANVRAQSYLYVSLNGQPQQFKYVIVTTDKLLLYTSRATAYPTDSSTEPVLSNAERQTPYVFSALDVTEVGPLKLQLLVYQDTFVFDFRTAYEKESVQAELTTPPRTGVGASSPSAASMPGFDRMTTRSTSFTMSIGLPPPPQLDEGAPPPPIFFEEDEGAPPPPPPDFDDDFSSAPPSAPPTPSSNMSFFAPVPEDSTLKSSNVRSMPLFDDDDDDDIPQFIKDKKRQQAAAAAAPTPAPAPPTNAFKPPVRSNEPAVPGAGLGLDFDFSFDLPPAPDTFDLPPPSDEPIVPINSSAAPVRKPLFGANRGVAAEPKKPEPVNSKYNPVEFEDDDDLPPPGAGNK